MKKITAFAFGRQRSGIAVAGVIMASIAFVIELTLVPMALPALKSKLGLTVGELAWIFNIYTLSVAVAVLVGGWLGDQKNSTGIFSLGVLLFVLGSTASALSTNFNLLMFARIVQGTGGGLFSALVPILLTKKFPRKPGKILIIWGSIAGYFAAFAPLVGGVLISKIGWQSVFLAVAVFGGVALILVCTHSPIKNGNDEKPPRNYRELLAVRPLYALFCYIFCTNGCISLFLFRLPLQLDAIGYSANFIGVLFAIMWLTFSLVSGILQNALDGAHLKIILISAPVFIAAGFIISLWNVNNVHMILSAVLLGVGFAGSNAPSTLLVLKLAPSGLRAFSASLDITFARFGGFAAVAILSQAATHQIELAILSISATAFACGYIVLIHDLDRS